MISYGRQTIEQDDIAAVVEALRSDFLTQGPLVERFEDALCQYTGSRYAVVCSNGTAALHLAHLAAGIGEGDCVLTSPNTFLASANSALYVGATPVFSDIDPETYCLDTRRIEDAVKANPGIRAIVPVHYSGLASGMEDVAASARRHGLIVIEDACHALGAMWLDGSGTWHKVGSSSRSDMTVFSFHPVKSITTGEGGAVTTNSRELYERLRLFRNHGVEKDPERFVNTPNGPWYYEMQELGFNYRLTDIQCALGLSQLEKLDHFVKRRSEIAALYTKLFERHSFIKTPSVMDGHRSSHHLYPLRMDFDLLGISRAEFFEAMRSTGVNPQVHYIPVHLQPYYARRFGFKYGDFPEAERFYREEVSLPIYPLLTDEEAGGVVESVISTIAFLAAAAAKKPSARVAGLDS